MEVTQSASGPEAIEAVAGDRADLLLLDVMMPEITGPELLTYLRSHAPVPRHAGGLPDGQGRPEDIDQLMKAGAAAVITKPFDAMQLPET
jgi:two-component system OmpR family response regulator